MLLKFLGKYRDLGLLILRLGVGAAFIVHGIGKFMVGSDAFKNVGAAMGLLGIPGSAETWGIVVAATEAAGGLLLLIGLAYRPACLVLAFTMALATAHLYVNAKMRSMKDFPSTSHPLKMAFVFIGLACVGPGRFSVDKD